MPIRYKICQTLYPNELIFTFLNIPDDFMPFWASFDAIWGSQFPIVKYVRVKYSKRIFNDLFTANVKYGGKNESKL